LEYYKALHVDIPIGIKDLVSADSKALGIPAYKLYRKILEDFIRKPAAERKKIYTIKRRASRESICTGHKGTTGKDGSDPCQSEDRNGSQN